ncbi:MAG: tetratricopeptide repeat protein [Luteolibacter sp.]
MKKIFLFIFLLACQIHAQVTEVSPVDKVDDLLPSQKEFLNLPEEDRKDFAKNFGEAVRFFQQKRIFECLDAIDEAEQIFPNSAELMNLEGSCYVEMRNFDKAMEALKMANEINPKSTSILFNIGEVYFVTKEWQKSHDIFEKVFAAIPEDGSGLSRLVEFKILLCKLKLDQKDEAIILAEKYDFQDDSPYYYYAKATIAYDEGDNIKAEEWLARANRIFRNPNIVAPWQDTLVEYGYIKSFYGEEDIPVE